MKNKNFKDIITEMKLMLNDTPSMTMGDFLTETFILPESFDDNYFEGQENDVTTPPSPQQNQQVRQPQNNAEQPVENKISGIEKELTDIRKIALNVITRLADEPSCEQYQLMKKIWNIVDKAIENVNNNGSNEV